MDIKDIVRRCGGAAELGQKIGRHRTTIIGWERVPVEHARIVAGLLGVPLSEIRPDVWRPSDGGRRPLREAQR